ncbi:hypothetical protein [Dyella telluris]|uniref:Uncharacterized protein n=1 Tax=Dyella telluris TaxID=2763498 RepID=A0A7G8Q1R7_9GAMM|nr:hypothetical protein [Dyella telluris]QNK00725.1 hypothetical protein H8F01_16780 [Dyella telluris]
MSHTVNWDTRVRALMDLSPNDLSRVDLVIDGLKNGTLDVLQLKNAMSMGPGAIREFIDHM